MNIEKMSNNGRKLPLGLCEIVDNISHCGTAPFILGIFLFVLPFLFKPPIGLEFFQMAIPWFWTDAGEATVTKVERLPNFDGQAEEKISYTYIDPQGVARKSYNSTKKKVDFFVQENRYPLKKFKDNWRLTALSDLDIFEINPLLGSVIELWKLAGIFIFYGLLAFWLGNKVHRWKIVLLRYGTHTIGTFLQEETAPIYWRILGIGVKKYIFQYKDDYGKEQKASFVRSMKKNELLNVDIFYDPLEPNCSFILQNLDAKSVFYSSDNDTISVSWGASIFGVFMKVLECVYWAFLIYIIVKIVLLFV
ncbi:MAG: hypothetical protein LBK06_07340 [Planctomycetaceae bacterium]|jgi:hypothetical protein|nr:hypothetical protein [Planctomycetaceae bacterium]